MWRGGGATRGRSIDRGGSTRTGQARERAHPGEDRDRERQQSVEPVRDRVRHRVRAARSERREGRPRGGRGGGGVRSARETWRAAVNAMTTIHENARRPVLLSNRSNVVASLPASPPCTLAARAGFGPGCRLARARRSRRRRSRPRLALGGGRASARDHLRLARGRPEPAPPRVPETRRGGALAASTRGRGRPRGRRFANAEDRSRRVARVHPPPSIPRVIHVLWKTEKLPAFAEAYVSGWIADHPAWRVRRWTDADMLAFVRERSPRTRRCGTSSPPACSARTRSVTCSLSALGGVYVDLDMESLRPMDPLLANRRCLLGQEPAAHVELIAGVPRRACNAWMASEANHPFWDAVLDEIRTRARTIPMTKFNPPRVTGPEALQAALDGFSGRDEDGPGCGVVDPPEALFPAVDKSAIAGMRAKCEGLTRGRGVNPDKAAGVGCPAPLRFIPGRRRRRRERRPRRNVRRRRGFGE